MIPLIIVIGALLIVGVGVCYVAAKCTEPLKETYPDNRWQLEAEERGFAIRTFDPDQFEWSFTWKTRREVANEYVIQAITAYGRYDEDVS